MVARGEIYLVNLDGDGHVQSGRRPAVIIQNDTGNLYSSTTIVATLTTRDGPEYPVRVRLAPKETGLREHSTVQLDQLHTIDSRRLRDPIGRVTPNAMVDVDRALRYSLGLIDF